MAYAAQYGKLVPGGVGADAREHVLGHRLRHRIRDGRPRRRLSSGLKSSAILLGRYDVTGVMVAHGLFLTMMAVIGYWQFLGVLYYAGLAVAAVLVLHQYQLIEDAQPRRLLQGVSQQQLGGLRDLCWASRSTSTSASGSRSDPSRRLA